jgi:hypothetical protein
MAVRAETVELVHHSCAEGNDLTEDYHVYSLQFAEEALLWSSAGVKSDGTPKTYGDNKPKVGYMTMRIGENTPLQGQMAKCRYHVCRYVDQS